MSKSIYIVFFLFLLFLSSFAPETAFAQKKKANGEEKAIVNFSSVIVNQGGEPIANATVTLGEGIVQTKTDAVGRFSMKVKSTSTLLIEAKGYKPYVLKIADAQGQDKITLETELFLASENDMVRLPLSNTLSQRQLTGAVSNVKGKELESYNDINLSNMLQGRLMGLNVEQNSGGLGTNAARLTIRGLSRGGADDALVVVDGIERPLDFILPEEIESIEVVKDATAKILYGPRAANGVLLITTKRGRTNTRQLQVSTDYGVNMVTRLPEYLNSAEYATLYNEARVNDGLTPFYTDAQLEGYRNSKGPNDLYYPNVDYYDYFINKTAPYRKATLQYIGGGNDSKYAFVAGYVGTNGFEKIGKSPAYNRINLRGNLDFQVSPMLKAFVDANAVVTTNSWSGISQGGVFNALSSQRPNEYPIILDDPKLADFGKVLGQDYVPPMGGSFLRPNNLYADLVYGGLTEQSYFYGQTNIGLDLKLDEYVKGLSIKSIANFDSYQFFQTGKPEVAATYARNFTKTAAGADTITYVTLRPRIVQPNKQRQAEAIVRNLGLTTTVSYVKTFDVHELQAYFTHFIYRNEDRNLPQDIENTNMMLRVHYGFRNKLYAEATMARMGSNKFPRASRQQFFPAVGAAWILSEEPFLKDNAMLTFLKLKGSFGILGYDRSTEFYIFANRWADNGTVGFNERNTTNQSRTNLDLIGNPDLLWEKSREINVGLEGYALKNTLQFEINYFNTLRYDIIQNPNSLYSALAGGLTPRRNMGKTRNQGVEGRVYWEKPAGDFIIGLGGNVLYAKNKILATNQIYDANNPQLSLIDQSSDAIFGLTSNGLFTSAGQVSSSPYQTYGNYGVGDLAYADINGDGIIDDRDQQVIGNTYPRTTLGLEVNLRYKRFGLFVLGTSQLGQEVILNNTYYRNNAEGKYSVLANERYHPVNNPNGMYPRLTTTNGVNNNQASTFWLADASFLRAKNVEVSYTVNNGSAVVKSYRFYVRGTNLFVLSKIKDSDPEAINAGINSYPIFRTITGGVSVSF